MPLRAVRRKLPCLSVENLCWLLDDSPCSVRELNFNKCELIGLLSPKANADGWAVTVELPFSNAVLQRRGRTRCALAGQQSDEIYSSAHSNTPQTWCASLSS